MLHLFTKRRPLNWSRLTMSLNLRRMLYSPINNSTDPLDDVLKWSETRKSSGGLTGGGKFPRLG